MLCHILDTPLELGYILGVFHSFLALVQSLLVSIFFFSVVQKTMDII